jgi:hypothetical protein
MKQIPLPNSLPGILFALFVSLAPAGTISVNINGLYDMGSKTLTLTFPSDSSIRLGILENDVYGSYSAYSDSLDLFLMDASIMLLSMGEQSFVLHTDSPGFWIPLDTAKLDLGSPLDLEDPLLFKPMLSVSVESYPLFIFQTNEGDYALCNADLNGTLLDHLSSSYRLTGMVLNCEIQADGTPTFESFPQDPVTPDIIFTYITPQVYSDTITVRLDQTGDSLYFYSATSRLRRMAPDSSDLCFVEVCTTEEDSECLYEMNLCGRSVGGSLWTVKDTAALDLDTLFNLSDISIFTPQGSSLVLSAGIYGPEQFFVALLGSGQYAFCHGTLADTTMSMACKVQVDGTPLFWSIPHYTRETIVTPPYAIPPKRSLAKPTAVQVPYRVNGAHAGSFGATGVRVGKGTAVRDR